MNYFKPVSISLSPNVEKDDLKLALNLIIRPWLWQKGRGIEELEDEFKKYLGVRYAVSFNSGRSALYAILKAAGKQGDKVAMQAFTCNAAPNPVLWNNMTPVYIDCDKNTFNMDISNLQGSDPCKILILQHTFGLPANLAILNFCKKNNIFTIEDCAHALGGDFGGKKLGTFGDAAFFSFARDKVISSVYGGMAVTNNDEVGKKLQDLQKEFGPPAPFWTFQQLLHPILLHYIILPIYNFLDLGKIFLVLSQGLHILSKAVHWKEKRGMRPDYFPRALPNALAALAYNQLHKIDKFYAHRKRVWEFYVENLKNTSFILPQEYPNSKQSYLRFTIKHPKAHEIIYDAWHKQNILLGDWYTTPIAPFDTNLDNMKYTKGSCPNAESLAKQTLNLPTHVNISQKDAERIVNFLKQWK